MTWDDLITRLRELENGDTLPRALATSLRCRVELELTRCNCTDLPWSDVARFGDSIDSALEQDTALFVREALAFGGKPRPGQLPIEALCERLDHVLVTARKTWASASYARHRGKQPTLPAVYRYLKLSTFLRHLLGVPRDDLPRPGRSSKAAVAILLKRALKSSAGKRIDLSREHRPVWVCGGETTPHHQDPGITAIEVARRLALAGLETKSDREVAMGLVALTVFRTDALQRPTITEATAPGSCWFFPGPKGRTYGRTRPLDQSMTSWGTDPEQGVHEWLLPPTSVELSGQDANSGLVWWQLFDEFANPGQNA